ncbi:MAG: 4,5-DOPA dioxygenase extradiol [Gammaproteobacteria bacterium]|nr:4,5-DOPA dioxygenase extradiol [Pseudomonadales bacterium]
MPVVFVGHGSPMNAIEENRWSRGFSNLAQNFGRPRAILAISAHWYVDGTFLTGNQHPQTIHDFGGFPEALYQVRYPAPGSPEVAERVRELLAAQGATLRLDWGLDHGTWSVLRWMYPDADIPVVQLSIDRRLEEREHIANGSCLKDLRKEGILIVASGNIVHNLRDAFSQQRTGRFTTPDWARQFDEAVVNALETYRTDSLLALSATAQGRMAHPTPDHWLPLLYAYGAAEEGEPLNSPIVGFDWGSLSMRSIVFGSR